MGIVFTRLFSSLFGNREARILVLGLDNAGKTTILYRLQMGEVVSTIPTIGFNVETVHYNNIKFQVWDLGGQTSIRLGWTTHIFGDSQLLGYTPPNQPMRPYSLEPLSLVHGKEFGRVGLQGNASSSCGLWPIIDVGQQIDLLKGALTTHRNAHSVIRPYWRCYFPNTQAIIYVVDSSDTDRLVTAKEEFHAILEEDELKGAVVLVYANKQDLPGALDDAAITESLELHKIKSRQWAIFKTSAIKGDGLFEGLDWLSNTLKSGSS